MFAQSIAVINSWALERAQSRAAKAAKKMQTQTISTTPKWADPRDEGFTILDALSASGLRALRYAKEIDGVKLIVANDLEAGAYEAILRNVRANNLDLEMIVPSQNDARYVNVSFPEIPELSNKYQGSHVLLERACSQYGCGRS